MLGVRCPMFILELIRLYENTLSFFYDQTGRLRSFQGDGLFYRNDLHQITKRPIIQKIMMFPVLLFCCDAVFLTHE